MPIVRPSLSLDDTPYEAEDRWFGTESHRNRIWSGRRGSNPRPSAWEADGPLALPTQTCSGNFRPNTGRFGLLTQDVLSI
jgi:hypothetical protein